MSLPVQLIEKLDKLTTYKNRSRSKYIANAITQRIEAVSADLSEVTLQQALGMAHARLGNSDKDVLMKAIIENYLNPVKYE